MGTIMFTCKPGIVGVFEIVFQSDASSQEKHEFRAIQFRAIQQHVAAQQERKQQLVLEDRKQMYKKNYCSTARTKTAACPGR